MARANLRTGLRRSRCADPMARYDRLPPELRRWLAQAALPWNPRSSLKLWNRCLKKAQGNVAAAEKRLHLAEAKMLQRDFARTWGENYPISR